MPTSMFADNGDMRISKNKSALKNQTQELISSRLAQESVDTIVIDGCAYLYIPVWPVGGTIQDYVNKGSGTLLVRLYKDAGTPAIECSPTKF